MPSDLTPQATCAVTQSDPPRVTERPLKWDYRHRIVLTVSVVALIFLAWWLSGFVLAYTDDAYLTSELVSVTPEVSGPVDLVAVIDNQFVVRGQLLFTIDPAPFDLELKQAKARQAEALAQLPVDRAQLDYVQAQARSADAVLQLAKVNLERDSPLNQSGYIPTQSLDKTRSALTEAAAQRTASYASVRKAAQVLVFDRASLATAEAAVMLSEWRQSRTKVVAPVDGYITNLSLQRGDMLQPARAAMALVDAHAWRVIANVKEYDLRHLTPGHSAWVWLDTHPWRLYHARVQGVAHGISRMQQEDKLVPYVSPTVNWIRLQRRVPVRLTLVDPPAPGELFMGTDARVIFAY